MKLPPGLSLGTGDLTKGVPGLGIFGRTPPAGGVVLPGLTEVPPIPFCPRLGITPPLDFDDPLLPLVVDFPGFPELPLEDDAVVPTPAGVVALPSPRPVLPFDPLRDPVVGWFCVIWPGVRVAPGLFEFLPLPSGMPRGGKFCV